MKIAPALSMIRRSHVLTAEQVADAVRRYVAGVSAQQIANELGVVPSALSHHFRKAAVAKKAAARASAVCRHCGIDFTYLVCHARGAPRLFCSAACRLKGYRGEIHANRRPSDVAPTYKGYVVVRIPEGHVTGRSRHKNWMPEHILVAERALGRPLRKGEVVHHINGDKADNRNQNLLVCGRAYHQELHARMSLLYQQEKFGRAA